MERELPTVAVWKFASCDGCQLTLLDCEDELLELAGEVRLAYFLEASSSAEPGPYDISIVEGSISTAADRDRLRKVREQSRILVTVGACASAGGIQALRNFADVDEFLSIVYAQPQFISTLAQVTPIASHVRVDIEVRGCPVTKAQLLETVSALLAGRRPRLPSHSVCVECKQAGNPCLLVAGGVACLGPVTHAGCGALCPSYARGCYGCFGPMDSADGEALVNVLREVGLADDHMVRMLRTFNSAAPAFAETSTRLELPHTRSRLP